MEKNQNERSFIIQLQPTLNERMLVNYQTGGQWDNVAYNNVAYNKERGKKYIHCSCCNHIINLARRSRHYKSNKHIDNVAIHNNINEMYQEMKQIYDANVLVLERINSTMLQIQEMVR